MITIIKNYNVEDCKYFKWNIAPGCCGRGPVKSGGCGVPVSHLAESAQDQAKLCSKSSHYCKYEKKTEV